MKASVTIKALVVATFCLRAQATTYEELPNTGVAVADGGPCSPPSGTGTLKRLYKNQPSPDAAACQLECDNIANCVAWSQRTGPNVCYMYGDSLNAADATASGFTLGAGVTTSNIFISANLTSFTPCAMKCGTPFFTCGGASGGSVSGDPIAAFGNKRVEFHLPVHVPTLLFQGRHMKIWGSTFPGLFGDQWFERIFVLSETDTKVIEVSIKNDLLEFIRDPVMKGKFETLNVAQLPERTPLDEFPSPPTSIVLENLTVSFKALPSHCARAPQRECVSVASPTSKIVVCSSSASEFFGTGPGAYEFAHLDVDFVNVEAEGSGATTGLLPELWGLAPISDRTRTMIVKEWTEDSGTNHTQGHDTNQAGGHGSIDVNVIELGPGEELLEGARWSDNVNNFPCVVDSFSMTSKIV